MRAELATRPHVGLVVFGVATLGATQRLLCHAGRQVGHMARTSPGPPPWAIERSVEGFLEELRALRWVTAQPVLSTQELEAEAGKLFGAGRPAGGWGSWTILLRAVTAFEAKLATDLAEVIDELYLAVVDPFTDACSDESTVTTVDICMSAWSALAEAGYGALCPQGPAPRRPLGAGAPAPTAPGAATL